MCWCVSAEASRALRSISDERYDFFLGKKIFVCLLRVIVMPYSQICSTAVMDTIVFVFFRHGLMKRNRCSF